MPSTEVKVTQTKGPEAGTSKVVSSEAITEQAQAAERRRLDEEAAAKKGEEAEAKTEAKPRKTVDLVGLFERAQKALEKAKGPLHAKAIQKALRIDDSKAHALYVAMLRDAEVSDGTFVKTKPGYFDTRKLARQGQEVPYKNPATKSAKDEKEPEKAAA